MCSPVGETIKALRIYGDQVLLAPTDLALHPFWPRDQVNLETWKTGSLQISLLLRGTELSELNHPFLPEVAGITLWGQCTRMKRAPEPQPPERQPGATDTPDYLCEPLSGLKLLF